MSVSVSWANENACTSSAQLLDSADCSASSHILHNPSCMHINTHIHINIRNIYAPMRVCMYMCMYMGKRGGQPKAVLCWR